MVKGSSVGIHHAGRTLCRRALGLVGGGAILIALAGAAAQEPPRAGVEQLVAEIARHAATACPLGSPSDQEALERCRTALYRGSPLRSSLAPIVIWGRPSPEGKRLKDTTLTQFSPDVWSGLYAPLFMFTGDYELGFDATERLFRARLRALFRNGLDPGLYPYPFWHDARKWNAYQTANGVTFWIDPAKLRVVAAQFSTDAAADPRLKSAPRTPPPFDGKWMWTDQAGVSQPRPALFVGLLRADNPYLAQIEGAYRVLAGELRKATCSECHEPENRDGMRRLVLMQTPVHAAGEIKRMMHAVREDKMPLDDTGLHRELDSQVKADLLKYGTEFEALIDAARDWEKRQP
jgi:hypothetical protein